jgi:flavin reductase (DIM6/NTAB) family NADH-FMN oxidoreductase RutF
MMMIVTWVSQVSFFPQLLSVALENDSELKSCVEQSGFFSLNILPTGSKALAAAFLRPEKGGAGTVGGRSVESAPHGSPLLLEAAACVECRLLSRYETGDHTVMVGEVVDARTRITGDVLTMAETGWNYQR